MLEDEAGPMSRMLRLRQGCLHSAFLIVSVRKFPYIIQTEVKPLVHQQKHKKYLCEIKGKLDPASLSTGAPRYYMLHGLEVKIKWTTSRAALGSDQTWEGAPLPPPSKTSSVSISLYSV